MTIFDTYHTNLLPYDGEVNYYANILPTHMANHYFNALINNIAWQNDEVYMFGKHIITQRKVAWYANDGKSYAYANTTKMALPFTPLLLEIKAIAEKITQTKFNSCLLNLYHNGSQGMGWHSDNEKSILANSTIASFSFGADRRFTFKHKTSKQTINILLHHGSMLLMKNTTQAKWWHSLPKSKKINAPRINLTFRQMV
ncbi:MAG: alpha-ketoglutarate-dependent dioxygenase AlkB [Sphingobacteriales bacterium]|nr:MAG: alpha-ketoglutarate-dependent dioxygenase AlkB [Sphingobacteriales bacterium]